MGGAKMTNRFTSGSALAPPFHHFTMYRTQIFLPMAVSGRCFTCVPAASSSSASVGVGIYRLKYYFTWLFQVSHLCARHVILVLGICRGGPLPPAVHHLEGEVREGQPAHDPPAVAAEAEEGPLAGLRGGRAGVEFWM